MIRPPIRTNSADHGRRLVALGCNTSQLDEPVYRRFAELRPGNQCTVLYWNDFGLSRTRQDPELGVVPVFPAPPAGVDGFERIWIDSRKAGVAAVLDEVLRRRPDLLLVNDVPLRPKLRIAATCRMQGIPTAFRSDKNQISDSGRGPVGKALERLVYGTAFSALCYVGDMTRDYYPWTGKGVLFPYPSDAEKFRPPTPAQRKAARSRFGLPPAGPVLLSVIKFNEREGGLETCQLYARVLQARPDAHVLLVGSGPLQGAMESIAAEAGCAERFHFAGYVPYAELEMCFMASDIFLQFARCEPWGVSVLDALSGGLAVVASDQVGSALEVMTRKTDLRRYVVPWGDLDQATAILVALVDDPDRAAQFSEARRTVLESYSVEATARRLDEFVGRLS